MKMSAIEIACEEAVKAGAKLDEAILEYIIWEETGFPSFFTGDPETCFREQLQKVLGPIGVRQKEKQERDALQEILPTQWERLKDE